MSKSPVLRIVIKCRATWDGHGKPVWGATPPSEAGNGSDLTNRLGLSGQERK